MEKPGAEAVPLYSAVRLCEPAESDGAQVAVFPVSATAAQRVVRPSLKVTVPWLLGLASLAEVTVAVNVRESP